MLETRRFMAGGKVAAGGQQVLLEESRQVFRGVTLLLPWFEWRPIRSLDDKANGYLAGQGIDLEAIGYASTKDAGDISIHLKLFLKDGRWGACGGLGREIYVPEDDVGTWARGIRPQPEPASRLHSEKTGRRDPSAPKTPGRL